MLLQCGQYAIKSHVSTADTRIYVHWNTHDAFSKPHRILCAHATALVIETSGIIFARVFAVGSRHARVRARTFAVCITYAFCVQIQRSIAFTSAVRYVCMTVCEVMYANLYKYGHDRAGADRAETNEYKQITHGQRVGCMRLHAHVRCG